MNVSMRFRILARDNFTCRYCGASAPDVKLQVDHILPSARGGPDDPSNLVTACFECNIGKSDYLLPMELIELVASRDPLPAPIDIYGIEYEVPMPVSFGVSYRGPDMVNDAWKCSVCGVVNSLDGDVCSCKKRAEKAGAA